MNAHSLTVLEFEKVRRMLLRWTFSSLGAERIEALAPELALEEIELSQERISEWKALELSGEISAPDEIEDLRHLFVRLRRDSAGLSGVNLYRFLPFLDQVHQLHRLMKAPLPISESHGGEVDGPVDRYPRIRALLSAIGDVSALRTKLARSVSEEGEVLSDASPALARARQGLNEAQRNASELMDKMLLRLQADKRDEAFVTLRDDRYVVSVRSQHRDLFPGFLHGRSQTGHSVLLEPVEALDVNNRVAERREESRLIEARVLAELTDALRSRLDELESAYEAVGECDQIRAMARVALDLRAEPPTIERGGTLRIVRGRHPILADQQLRGGPEVVPLDLEIDPDVPILLISGPNMGGKTVALKTVGLLLLMAKSGMHIPADPGTEMPMLDDVFVDLGDEQSIEADLSTFAGHLRNLGELWSGADAESLVLLDELGGATDPEEGAALAMAVLDGMARRQTLTVATTHLTALKLFAQDHEAMDNASMEFDAVSLQPRFRLKIGEPGRSRAFDIARRILPGSDLLDRAQEYRSPHLVEIDKIFERVDGERRQLAEERGRLEAQRREHEELTQKRKSQIEKMRVRIEALRDSRGQMIEDAYKDAERSVQEIRERLEAELRQGRGERSIQAARTAERDLRSQRGKAQRPRRRDPSRRLVPEELSVGTEAWLPDVGAVVRIERIESSKARVDWMGRHLEVSLASLEQIPEDRARSTNRIAVRVQKSSGGPIARELDLRGERVEEALERLERFIDAAVMNDVGRVRIVHGKGTGVLKSEVEKSLRRSPLVEEFRVGEPSEGGWGVTVANLGRNEV